ncbi:MAG: N5-carboxyaminoimidazole ribonucleotide synthase [Bacteroidia bacterium]|nr:N5-carboxyaminoimidazole ribonucleotide synthase [Bacteroidia bacterium]
MSKPFYNNFKLGVLGGGQLGKMLIQEAVNLNISTYILDPDANAPCKDLCTEFFHGSLKDFDTVYNFGKQVDLLTIEVEHVNVEAMEKLQAEGISVFPQPEILRMVQDKGLQKQFYRVNKIPTAPFHLVNNKEEIKQFAAEFPFFQKLRKEGYDGRGVVRLTDATNIEKAFDAPSVLEKLVDFEKEISVIVSRNAKGEIAAFPTVELVFNPEANLVEHLFSPANISTETEKQAKEIAVHVIESLKMVGLLAVEMFLTKTGEILVNEIAPRPHNSGHQTIEGNFTSQYMQHLRAILNLPRGNTDIKTPAVMVNLLGEPGFTGDAVYEGIEEVMKIDGVNIHLYGKTTTKPFRKMGHVTIIDNDLRNAMKKAERVKKILKVKSA